MASEIKAEISRKNRFWLEKHRYYELKHFCLQYPLWKRERSAIRLVTVNDPAKYRQQSNDICRSPEELSARLEWYDNRIGMVERAAKLTDPVIGNYILEGVANGWSYDILRARENVPCCRDSYYAFYRQFFYILSSLRD